MMFDAAIDRASKYTTDDARAHGVRGCKSGSRSFDQLNFLARELTRNTMECAVNNDDEKVRTLIDYLATAKGSSDISVECIIEALKKALVEVRYPPDDADSLVNLVGRRLGGLLSEGKQKEEPNPRRGLTETRRG